MEQLQHRQRALPQPSVPLQEVGLKALQPMAKALGKIAPAKSAPILQAVSSLLQHVAPLRMFSDFSPAHSPPEAPIVLAESQVNADSVKNATSYAVFNAFDPKHAEPFINRGSSASGAAAGVPTVWTSKAKPNNNKSCITVSLSRPEQLTGIYLELPSEAGMKPELIGLEALHAPHHHHHHHHNAAAGAEQGTPSASSSSSSSSSAASSSDMTAADIAAYLHRPNLKWTPLGVLSAQVLEQRAGSASAGDAAGSTSSDGGAAAASPGSGVRLPLTAHNIIALRISFKGYAKGNTERYHGLAKCVLFKADDRIRPASTTASNGGAASQQAALYTDSTAVLHTLDGWFRAVGMNAASSSPVASATSSAANQEAQDASVLSLAGLSLATGSLSSTLSLLEVLLHYNRPLPAPLSRAVRGYIHSLDSLFDATASRTTPKSGKAGPKMNPDRTALAKWVDKSSSVTLSNNDTHARSTSSPEYAGLNIGISRGKMVWEMRMEEDSRDGECSCYGFCKKPVTTYSYDSSSNNMWLWRAYNGQLYALGSSGESKDKYHPKDIVRFELDMDEDNGVCRGWVNGKEQGILFRDLRKHGPLFPCAQFYSSNRECSIQKVLVYSNNAVGPSPAPLAGGAGGAAAEPAAIDSTWLAALKYSQDETSVPAGTQVCVGNLLTNVVPIHDPSSLTAATTATTATTTTGAGAAGAGAADAQAASQEGGAAVPAATPAAASTATAAAPASSTSASGAASSRLKALRDPRTSELVPRAMTIHGQEVRSGVAIPLPEDVPAPAAPATVVTTTSKVVYQLGTSADADAAADGSTSKKKKSKDAGGAGGAALGPSRYDVFEAIVGLCDVITDPTSSVADIDSSQAVMEAAIAEGQAEEEAEAQARAALASSSAPPTTASVSTAAVAVADEDSKEEEGHVIERESKDDEGAATTAATAAQAAAAAPASVKVATTLTFRVVGDGKPLWTSPEVAIPSSGLSLGTYASFARIPAHHCLVNIAGVNKLELEVTAVTPVVSPSAGGSTPAKDATVRLPPNVVPVWADARVRVAPFVADRLLFEKEMMMTQAAEQQQTGAPAAVDSLSSPSEDEDKDRTAADQKPYPLLDRVIRRQAHRALRIPLLSSYLYQSPQPAKFAAEACSPYYRFTHKLLHPSVALDGPLAATAILRLLRLFAREAYKPVRLSTPVPKFGEEPRVLLEVPFVVQADGKVLQSLAGLMKTLVDRLKSSSSSSSASTTTTAEALASLLLITKGNLRRIVAAKVIPGDLGITLPHQPTTTSAAGGAGGASEDKGDKKGHGKGKAPAATASSGSASPAAASTPVAEQAQPHQPANKGTLGPLLDTLNELINASASAAAAAVPAELSAEAANVLDTGLPLFFPSAALQNAFLNDLLGKGEGGVLEVQFSWPTLLSASDPASAAALQALSAKGKASIAAAAAGAGADGKPSSSSSDKDGAIKERDEVTIAAMAAIDRLAASAAGGAAGASALPAKGASASIGDQALADPRFERAILLLQSYATRRGLPHTTVGHYGRFLHLVISLPDSADMPIVRTLSSDLAAVFETAGLAGWSFPTGLHSPDISFKIERFLEFNRRERLATDPGVGWVRLYPRKTANAGAGAGAAGAAGAGPAQELQGVMGQVRSFLDGYIAEEKKEQAEKEAAAAAAAASAAGGAGAKEKDKEGAATPAAAGGKSAPVVLDVFGDPISTDESGEAQVTADEEEEEERRSRRSRGRRSVARSEGTSETGTEDEGDEGQNEDDDEGTHYDDDEDEDAEEEEEEEEEEDEAEEEEEDESEMGGLFE